MKIISTRTNKDGSSTITIRLAPGEKAVMVNTRHHYRLGGQVDDIVASHVLTEAVPVYWCSIEQKWVEA